jgi:hypothetical protein
MHLDELPFTNPKPALKHCTKWFQDDDAPFLATNDNNGFNIAWLCWPYYVIIMSTPTFFLN